MFSMKKLLASVALLGALALADGLQATAQAANRPTQQQIAVVLTGRRAGILAILNNPSLHLTPRQRASYTRLLNQVQTNMIRFGVPFGTPTTTATSVRIFGF